MGLYLLQWQDTLFMEQALKINQEVYRRDSFETMVLPWVQQHFVDTDWTFQQDFDTRSEGEIDSGLMQDSFSRLHQVGGMAALLTRFQLDGLQSVVYFVGQLNICFIRNKRGYLAKEYWFRDKQTREYQKKWILEYRNPEYSREYSNALVDIVKSEVNNKSSGTHMRKKSKNQQMREMTGCIAHLTSILIWKENVTDYGIQINLAEKFKTTQAIAREYMRFICLKPFSLQKENI
ncbi:hypothetical protein LAZ67_3000219 [Cordylochernes scorpioides]|uniref:Uncharacterized protein n=1 Tax=Cordylochernes scorpioides TaxID=51811 RepID=A0ABY6K8Z8_9ARAC|nr:hypothetical protein LAZ67_3000219 [Cordylochernes scorpioides]